MFELVHVLEYNNMKGSALVCFATFLCVSSAYVLNNTVPLPESVLAIDPDISEDSNLNTVNTLTLLKITKLKFVLNIFSGN